jgi:exopolyphosphatase/guanosine-5'-triphosphate,3'-diphosphate pyrophosphatase
MRVGVIDVGANSVRLLVAERSGSRLETIEEAKAQLSLGSDIEAFGRISPSRRRQACDVVRRYVVRARNAGAVQLDTFVASPGRQAANGAAFARALATAAGAPVRVLSGEEEGELGFAGATAGLRPLESPLLVCDVGGGSTQIVVGGATGPQWSGGLDIGSLRLTQRFGLDRPRKPLPVGKAVDEVARLLLPVEPPQIGRALAAGGTARALAKLQSPLLDAAALEQAIATLCKQGPKQIALDHGLNRRRAERLLGGTLVLAAVQRLVGIPLEVAVGGVREGAVLSLLERSVAA